MKNRLWEMPEPSSAAVSGFVLLISDGRNLDLRFDYDRNGKVITGGIRFRRVRGHRHRAELYATDWHIADAYDALVEVRSSEWIQELTDAAPEDRRSDWAMHHFMITLDSAGTYEIVAQSWEILPEVEGSLSTVSGHSVEIG